MPRCGSALGCFALLVLPLALRAQEDVLPSGGMDAMTADYNKIKELAHELIHGTKVAELKDSSHVEALDVYAKYATYRLTWLPVQSKPGEIARLIQTFDGDVAFLAKNRSTTANAMKIFSAKVADHALEVLKTNKPIARVNAARELAKLADLGQPELVDTLAAVTRDPAQIDAVKLYAMRGLRDLAAQAGVVTGSREKVMAEVLAEVIDRKFVVADTTQVEDIEGFRYFRREAVRALAQIRNPGALEKGRSALTLLRVVAKDGLQPSPRIDERLEAAIGVARLKPSLDKDYNPDYAVMQLGLFLDDFVAEMARDREQAVKNGILRFPWKVMAGRLNSAFETMRNELPVNDFVVKVAAEAAKLLSRMEKAEPADPEGVLSLLRAGPAPSTQLFKSVAGSTVKDANRKDEAGLPNRLEASPDR